VATVSAPAGRPRPGRFVVLEGIDGAGKSGQARRLAAALRARGARVIETREPTDGEWGRRYRAWARGELDATPEQVLGFFVEDRRAHLRDLIRPRLEAGEWVVCDRYVASTLAYQAAQGIDRERLRSIFAVPEFPSPDLVLWLRLPVAQAVERLGADARERFERAAFLEKVDAEYARLGLEEVDATGAPEEVHARIWERVAPLLDG
jgi:dTMP kinase